MPFEGNPEGTLVRNLKYAVKEVKPWKPDNAKFQAIIDKFLEYPDNERDALRDLLALSGLRQFLDQLNHDRQRQVFDYLLRAYLRILLPDNAFRVGSTDKYRFQREACVITTRDIAKGVTIQNLNGKRIPLSEEELSKLVKAKNDFSVVSETNYCPTSLLVGPAHFINHSCDPNAVLQVLGDRLTIKVAALRHIAQNEEITISYGDGYFDSDCLCEVCRKLVGSYNSGAALKRRRRQAAKFNSGRVLKRSKANFVKTIHQREGSLPTPNRPARDPPFRTPDAILLSEPKANPPSGANKFPQERLSRRRQARPRSLAPVVVRCSKRSVPGSFQK